MRFEIEATYSSGPTHLPDEYPVLKNYGLTLEEVTRTWKSKNGTQSRVDDICFVELNSLEDLERLIGDVENPVVISKSYWDSNLVIEIYDGYRK